MLLAGFFREAAGASPVVIRSASSIDEIKPSNLE
jgi:hypothetical protein